MSYLLSSENTLLIHLTALFTILFIWFLIRIQVRNNRKQKKLLNETIELRTQQYKLQVERAEESERCKEEFLAHMSHEMRTPMNGVIGMTNLLLNTKINEDQRKYLKIIKESSDNLLKMINNILDLSKIEAGKITQEKIHFNLADVLKNVRDILSLKAAEKKIRFIFEIDSKTPGTLIGDPTHLNQVLVNLTYNALKFTDHGSVTLKIKPIASTSENTSLLFSVCDTGIGIQEDKLGTIFESFSQAGGDVTRKYGGTGLGLSICKKLVEFQGGSIDVKSEFGKGSEFNVRLSFGLDETANEYIFSKALDESGILTFDDLNILLVEDNPFNQAVAFETLHSFNDKMNVDIAPNGKIAVEKVNHNEYDVVLMDVQMPEMDGIEATGHIRRNTDEKKKNVPIIALTANANSHEAIKCMTAGMNEFVSKPFDPLDLFLKILKVKKENDLRYT